MLARKTSIVGSSKRMHATIHEDQLSNLPPDIITQILSCLPTKIAVRTSALSRNWRYMWNSIYNIQIDDGRTRIRSAHRFRKFVTWVLLATNSPLRSFDLSCSQFSCHPAELEACILRALRHKAEILNIGIGTLERRDDVCLWCFTGWTSSLRELRLTISCTVKFPSDNCFPNLKWLFLGTWHHDADESFKIMTTRERTSTEATGGRAVLDFPVLERLELCKCKWLELDFLEIQAPELISFKSYEEQSSYEIKICAPKLAMFESFGPINNYSLVAPAVTYVSLHKNLESGVFCPWRDHKVLKAIPKLKSLKITCDALVATVDRLQGQGLAFPAFSELKELEVSHCCEMESIAMLIKVLPSLESLLMDVRRFNGELDCQALTTIPQMCNLKRLHVDNFSGTEDQYNVVKYFLENANNLQEIKIWVSSLPQATKTAEEIRRFISNLKPERLTSVLVEHERLRGCWAGIASTRIMGQGGKTQLATTSVIANYNSLWCYFTCLGLHTTTSKQDCG